jgi:hypothetical protein
MTHAAENTVEPGRLQTFIDDVGLVVSSTDDEHEITARVAKRLSALLAGGYRLRRQHRHDQTAVVRPRHRRSPLVRVRLGQPRGRHPSTARQLVASTVRKSRTTRYARYGRRSAMTRVPRPTSVLCTTSEN